MFTPLSRFVNYYNINKDNNHPKFVERDGLQEIIDDIEEELSKLLPHGSGIDATWKIEHLVNLTFRCDNSYHAMDQNGMYCGWVDFSVVFDAHTNNFDVTVNQEDIGAIAKEYDIDEKNATEEELEEWNENNACPYLGDLDEYIYEGVSYSLEDYSLRETVKYIRENRPELLHI